MMNMLSIRYRYLCRITLFGLLILFFPPQVCTAGEMRRLLEPAEQRVLFQRLKKVQKNIKTLQAEFSEQRKIASLTTPLYFKGQLYYAREGLFFMAYNDPIHYILRVKEGEALFYVDGSPTADVVNISNIKGLAGHADLFAWNPEGFTGKVWEDDKGYRLEEKSEKAADHQKGNRLHMLLDKQTLMVKYIRIADGSGDITEITLSAIEIDLDLPMHVIEFTLPEGIRLNRLDQP